MSVKAIEALTALVAEQGKQIVELSKALAIAHEVYAPVVAQPSPVAAPAHPNVTNTKLYYSEDEEDEMYASGEMPLEDTRKALEEIIAAAGIPAPVTLTST